MMQVTTDRREKTIARPQNGIGYGRGTEIVAGSMEYPKSQTLYDPMDGWHVMGRVWVHGCCF